MQQFRRYRRGPAFYGPKSKQALMLKGSGEEVGRLSQWLLADPRQSFFFTLCGTNPLLPDVGRAAHGRMHLLMSAEKFLANAHCPRFQKRFRPLCRLEAHLPWLLSHSLPGAA